MTTKVLSEITKVRVFYPRPHNPDTSHKKSIFLFVVLVGPVRNQTSGGLRRTV